MNTISFENSFCQQEIENKLNKFKILEMDTYQEVG